MYRIALGIAPPYYGSIYWALRVVSRNDSKRLLFVDDEHAIRETLSLILPRYGFTVTLAATVAEALKKIPATGIRHSAFRFEHRKQKRWL